MGKTVATIVGVVAAIAIAVAAPYLAGVFLSAIGTVTATALATAITTAVIAVGLSVAVSFAFKALGIGSVPSAKLATSRPVGTAIVGVFSATPKRRLQPRMRRKRGGILNRVRRVIFGRFGIIEFVGDCLLPTMTGRFGTVDLDADLRTGDLMSFSVTDVRTAFPDYGTTGIVKRFLGLDVERGVVRVDCTNPPRIIEASLDNLLYAHRVRVTAPTRWEAIKMLWRVRRNPAAFETPLMCLRQSRPKPNA